MNKKLSTLPHKVFGIGDNKTGCATLGICFNILGLYPRSFWAPAYARFWDDKDPTFREAVVKDAKRFASVMDFPWNHTDIYKEFDEAYPGSKFILTFREPEVWFDSFRRWGTKGDVEDVLWRLKKSAPKNIVQAFKKIIKVEYGVEKVGPLAGLEEQYTKAHVARNNEVLEYFKDRPDDFLAINWVDGNNWERLCGFLNLPIPDVPFPHYNNSKK